MTEKHKTAKMEKKPESAAASGESPSTKRAPVLLTEEELAELRKSASEREEYFNLLQRNQADFQNYQKRIQREREQERQYYAGAVLAEFLPVLDNLERALAAAEEADEANSMIQGVKMVQSQFLEMLEKHGVRKIEAIGKTFDHNLHEALTQQPTTDVEPNKIIHVATTGYMIHDRVLRPAQVVVSAAME